MTNLTAEELMSGTPIAGFLDVARKPEHIDDPETNAYLLKLIEQWAARQDGKIASGPEVVPHDDPFVWGTGVGGQVAKDPNLIIQRWIMVPIEGSPKWPTFEPFRP